MVCKVKKLLVYGCHNIAACVCNGIVPFQKVAYNLPAVEINFVFGVDKGEASAYAAHISAVYVQLKFRQKSKHFLLYQATLAACVVVDYKLMSPGELAFYCVSDRAVLIKNIVAVEPAEKALFKVKFYIRTVIMPRVVCL